MRGAETEGEKHTNTLPVLRYAHERQHGRSAPATDPHSEEDNQEGGRKHHLTGVSSCVPDRQGKGHRTTQAWRREEGDETR